MTGINRHGLVTLLACALLGFTGCVMEADPVTDTGWHELDDAEEDAASAATSLAEDQEGCDPNLADPENIPLIEAGVIASGHGMDAWQPELPATEGDPSDVSAQYTECGWTGGPGFGCQAGWAWCGWYPRWCSCKVMRLQEVCRNCMWSEHQLDCGDWLPTGNTVEVPQQCC